MKLKINNFNEKSLRNKLNGLSSIDFSLFIDSIPELGDESPLNVLVLQEPNEYFGLHDWAIQNKDLFSFILTWDYKVLNNCDNAMFLPFGHTWFKPEQYEKNIDKKFQVSHLCGKLLKTYGHSLRHELLNRENEIKIPTKFFSTYGDRDNIEEARIGKVEVFGDSQFNIAIENTSHKGYFTEKILDCFLLKTIPIYWGCSDIGDFFNIDGIIRFNNVDDLIYILNDLDKNYYKEKKEIIEENWRLAKSFVDYEQNIINKITEVFKYNDLI